jgi:hypothetical protein
MSQIRMAAGTQDSFWEKLEEAVVCRLQDGCQSTSADVDPILSAESGRMCRRRIGLVESSQPLADRIGFCGTQQRPI